MPAQANHLIPAVTLLNQSQKPGSCTIDVVSRHPAIIGPLISGLPHCRPIALHRTTAASLRSRTGPVSAVPIGRHPRIQRLREALKRATKDVPRPHRRLSRTASFARLVSSRLVHLISVLPSGTHFNLPRGNCALCRVRRSTQSSSLPLSRAHACRKLRE